jgi:predicted PurR-regulated permease PerM
MFVNRQRVEQVAGVVLIAAIVLGCVFVLKPFAPTILWAAILCFVTWPLRELLMKWFRGRRTLTAALMTIILLVVLFIPFFVVGLTLTDSVTTALQWLEDSKEAGLYQPPDWVARVPFVGPQMSQYWADLAENAEPALNQLKPWLRQAGLWLLKHSIDVAQGIFSFALSILIAFFLYRDGEGVIDNLNEAFRRISGDYARRLFDVVKKTIYSVVYGAIGTAFAQGVVAGIGFALAGVPSPMLLGLLTFCLSFIPVGPPVVWFIAAVWLFSEGRIAWGIFMLVYGLLCISSIDNLMKPYIISRGSKLSFIITLMGILGGVAAFGVIGVFLGPVLLAVGFNLIHEILSQPSIASSP